VEAEVIDLRTILPLDVDALVESVGRTHHVLVVDEGWAMCGIGGEIAQTINELAFDQLDAPVGRLHPASTSHPFAPVLERAMLVDLARIVDGARQVLAGVAPVPDHWHTPHLSGASRVPEPAALRAPRPVAAPVERPPVGPGEQEITMPFGDLTVSEGTVVGWLKAVGDAVAAGELVAEIETDKAVVEIEAPAAGTLAAIEASFGAVVPLGGRIGVLKTGS
jgi:2-oxoisovalerate dehydrogenase E1 component